MDDCEVSMATPAKYFAHPPYRAELINTKTGWSGVMNSMGMNVLTFAHAPGVTITTFELATKIANKWNEN